MITITHTSKLVQLRKDKGLKQKDVAKEIGITASYYGMIKLGKRNPSLIHAQKVMNLWRRLRLLPSLFLNFLFLLLIRNILVFSVDE